MWIWLLCTGKFLKATPASHIISSPTTYRTSQETWLLLQIHKSVHVWCLHAVPSRQNPAAWDKNSSADMSVRLLGVTWFLLHRHLPGYRPWTDLQTPVDSGKGLLWLRLATVLKLQRCGSSSGHVGAFCGFGDRWNLSDDCGSRGNLWSLCGHWGWWGRRWWLGRSRMRVSGNYRYFSWPL